MDGRLEGYIHIDINPSARPDIVADVCNMKQIKTSSVEEILCDNVLEHVNNILKAMTEMHRALKPGGRLKIISPHALNHNFYSTPDHVHGFTYTTFNQFWQESHKGYPKFRCISRRLVLSRKLLQPLADKFPLFIERLYWLIEPDRIETELEAVK